MRSSTHKCGVVLTNDNRLLQTALDKALKPFGAETREMVLAHVRATHEALEFEDGEPCAFPSQGAIMIALDDLFGTPSLFIKERLASAIEQEIMACKCDMCGHASREECINAKCSCCDVEDQFAILARAESQG